jgi:hypothetical protein
MDAIALTKSQGAGGDFVACNPNCHSANANASTVTHVEIWVGRVSQKKSKGIGF